VSFIWYFLVSSPSSITFGKNPQNEAGAGWARPALRTLLFPKFALFISPLPSPRKTPSRSRARVTDTCRSGDAPLRIPSFYEAFCLNRRCPRRESSSCGSRLRNRAVTSRLFFVTGDRPLAFFFSFFSDSSSFPPKRSSYPAHAIQKVAVACAKPPVPAPMPGHWSSKPEACDRRRSASGFQIAPLFG